MDNMATTKEDSDTREEKVLVRYSSAEKSECIRAARAAGISVSSWIRMASLAAARIAAAGEATTRGRDQK